METTTAFIVRLWRDRRRGSEDSKLCWRGIIIHVPTGERTSVRSLQEVVEVMAMYLQPQSLPSDE
ncbi:MAG TPA: hypothetical protein EYP04_04320 [Anaerolineae bacterium]|nr:hypothetical protein [Anaerolineae bacterium]HIQ05691.1 hypothetical protein [Anaerolineae bacterium]